ncbi:MULTISPECIES: hypothetical protein [unclassified Arthrobacter]|uniref:hypothetical protein n=1 Tax=unclassified Arthrobacter TaxID=235627 RepID=UPI001F3B7F42|nr:hypothetical protein [Arthrobacter sp. FW305-BF8]UKA55586.1 hypothetical protein LFT45_06615 [Arthrobacter sp. FW305-BF8]
MHRANEDDAGSTDDAEVSHSISQAPEEILAYWTPERMAEAVPRDIRLPAQEETEES